MEPITETLTRTAFDNNIVFNFGSFKFASGREGGRGRRAVRMFDRPADPGPAAEFKCDDSMRMSDDQPARDQISLRPKTVTAGGTARSAPPASQFFGPQAVAAADCHRD